MILGYAPTPRHSETDARARFIPPTLQHPDLLERRDNTTMDAVMWLPEGALDYDGVLGRSHAHSPCKRCARAPPPPRVRARTTRASTRAYLKYSGLVLDTHILLVHRGENLHRRLLAASERAPRVVLNHLALVSLVVGRTLFYFLFLKGHLLRAQIHSKSAWAGGPVLVQAEA